MPGQGRGKMLLLRRCTRCGWDLPLPLCRHLLVGMSAAGGSEPQPTAAATAHQQPWPRGAEHRQHRQAHSPVGDPLMAGVAMRGTKVRRSVGGGTLATLGTQARPGPLAGSGGSQGPAPHHGQGPSPQGYLCLCPLAAAAAASLGLGTGTPAGGCARRRDLQGREGMAALGHVEIPHSYRKAPGQNS